MRLEPGQDAGALVGGVRVGAGQHVGEDPGVVPARLHESGDLAAVLGALADGVHVWRRGGQTVVDDDGPLDLETHRDREVGARAHASGDDHEVGREGAPVVEHDVGRLPALRRVAGDDDAAQHEARADAPHDS